MNIYQAAKISGITQKVLAKKLNISVSTLYRRRNKELNGGGRLMVDSRDTNTLDMFSGETLADEAKSVLASSGVQL